MFDLRTLYLASGDIDYPHWIARINAAGAIRAVALDSFNNVCCAGYTTSQGQGGEELYLCKISTGGSLMWQRSLGGTSNERGQGIGVDSSDNIYIAGYTQSEGQGGVDLLLVKYDANGAIQWQRSLGGSGTERAFGIAVTSGGDCYIAGTTDSQSAGSTDILICKYNSSGVIQWQRTLGGNSNDDGLGIALDGNGDLYVTGIQTSETQGGFDVPIAKYNSSGVIQWQRTLGGGSNDVGLGIATDSGNNAYIAGYTLTDSDGGDDVLIVKYDSSGAIQWQRTISNNQFENARGVATDASNNVYICGEHSTVLGAVDCLVAKYNSSGILQWTRSLRLTAASDQGYAMVVDSNGDMCIVGTMFIAKLPGDGSKTGTYGSYHWETTTGLTEAAKSLTDSATTLTETGRTLTDAARTLTDEARTLVLTTEPVV